MPLEHETRSVLQARRINLEGPELDPHGHFARVRLHLEDLQTMYARKDRRLERNVLERLVRMRFICVEGQCLCTPEARFPKYAARYDGWVHSHHVELTALLDSFFSLEQRRKLFDSAERYQTYIETKDLEGAPTFEELRIVQDWLFQSLDRRLRQRFDDWGPRPVGA